MIWFITVKGRHQFLEQCDTTWTLVKVTTAWRSHGWWKWSKGLSLPWKRLRFVCWVCHLWRSCGLQMVARAAASVTVCPSTPLLTSSCSEREHSPSQCQLLLWQNDRWPSQPVGQMGATMCEQWFSEAGDTIGRQGAAEDRATLIWSFLENRLMSFFQNQSLKQTKNQKSPEQNKPQKTPSNIKPSLKGKPLPFSTAVTRLIIFSSTVPCRKCPTSSLCSPFSWT